MAKSCTGTIEHAYFLFLPIIFYLYIHVNKKLCFLQQSEQTFIYWCLKNWAHVCQLSAKYFVTAYKKNLKNAAALPYLCKWLSTESFSKIQNSCQVCDVWDKCHFFIFRKLQVCPQISCLVLQN